MNMKTVYEDKTILITGGAGSIGSALAKKILDYNPKIIRLLDINETRLFNLSNELNADKIRILIGDIRDKERLARAIEDVDIVFHAAALKHVSFCESNPFEAVQTNVLGTKNLLEVAMDEEIEKFVTISTDKAVNPVNVLGASKLLAERLTVSANLYKGARTTTFSCVRFGNVLNSQGSVVPIFRSQVAKGGPVRITDLGMTRFIMSMDDAVNLVLKAVQQSKGGETFILKMPAVCIKDLAAAAIKELAPRYGYAPGNIEMEVIGRREGERMFEELMNDDEAETVSDTDDMFVLPLFKPDGFHLNKGAREKTMEKMYKSNKSSFLSVEAIQQMLKRHI